MADKVLNSIQIKNILTIMHISFCLKPFKISLDTFTSPSVVNPTVSFLFSRFSPSWRSGMISLCLCFSGPGSSTSQWFWNRSSKASSAIAFESGTKDTSPQWEQLWTSICRWLPIKWASDSDWRASGGWISGQAKH